MDTSSLPVDLDETAKQALQGYVRKSMKQMLVALSPNIGLSAEHLLAQYEQMTRPEAYTCTTPERNLHSAAMKAPTASPSRLQLDFQHECLHLTCSVDNIHCSLCQQNPNRRCQLDNNFATKQLEKQPLVSACGSSVRVSLKQYDVSGWRHVDCCSSSSQAVVRECDGICLEFSLLNGSVHDQWLQQGPKHHAMDEQSRMACEVLRSRKAGKKALLQGGWMSHHTPEQRIRVSVTDMPTTLVDLTIQENSEARLGKDVHYKLLVRAIREHSNEEVAQLVSQSFSVTTMRSKGSFKPLIPCLDDPVNKLEGLGEKTRRNLLDVRMCAASQEIANAVPDECRNTVTTVQEFQELVQCLEVNNHCPKALSRALLPEAAVEHAMRAVPTDNRARRWKSHPESQWELVYSCARGQIDWNSPDALLCHGEDSGGYETTKAGQASQEQAAKMAELADEAFQAWKKEGHPGWSVANVTGHCLQQLDQQQDVLSQPNMPACHSNHELALGDILGNAAASDYKPAPGRSFLSNFQSLDRHLQQSGTSTNEAAGSGAGQNDNSPSEGMRLYGICSTDGYRLLQDMTSTLGSEPGWRLGSEGSTAQPQGRNASPAPVSALSGFGANNSTSSSGSQGSAQLQSRLTCDGTAGACTRQRSSKRLASKHAQHATRDSLLKEPAERNPEARLDFEHALGQTLPEQKQSGAALPHRVPGCLGSVPGAKQPLQEGSWSSHSSCKGPAPCDTKAVLTLDQALDSMSATQSFSMGLYNPFAAAAARGDSAWQIPSSAGSNEGRDGRASSCSTITCDQDQLAFGLPQQGFSAAEFGSLPLPEPISFEDDPGFGLELDLRPCASLEPAPKRGKWSVPDQQQSCELAAATASAPKQSHLSLDKSLVSKQRMWSQLAGQSRAQPASAAADTFKLCEGIFSQPHGQPTSPFLDTHLGKQPELWGSSDLGSSCTDPKDMAKEIRKQQQQSFRDLLERQDL